MEVGDRVYAKRTSRGNVATPDVTNMADCHLLQQPTKLFFESSYVEKNLLLILLCLCVCLCVVSGCYFGLLSIRFCLLSMASCKQQGATSPSRGKCTYNEKPPAAKSFKPSPQ